MANVARLINERREAFWQPPGTDVKSSIMAAGNARTSNAPAPTDAYWIATSAGGKVNC